MTYTETLHYIESLETKHLVPDHENSLRLMAYLGDPQEQMPVIHVAGTNGKGSTIAFIKHIYMAAGYRVGTFTSPHILSPLELVHIDGAPVTEEAFAKSMSRIKEVGQKITEDGFPHPTAFECLTAASFLTLSESKLDAVIIETGMGGRYDATNVFSKPLLTVITKIARDHTAILGNTLKEIAWHKGGIIKPGVPTVLSPNAIDVIEVISNIVKETGDKLYLLDESFITEKILMTVSGTKLFHLKSNFFNYQGLQTSMLGRHQTLNLATALLCIIQLRARLPVTDSHIKDGIRQTRWQCRNELISRKPLIMIDGGHNPDCLVAVKSLLDEYYSDKRILTVFGVLGDKDIQAMLPLIESFSHKIILTKPLSDRAFDPRHLDTAHETEDNYTAAIKKALSYSDDKTMILIVGSLYLAAPARKWLFENVVGD